VRPYLFHHTWIDLDHVLAITPDDQVFQVKLDMAFGRGPVCIDYADDKQYFALLDEWRKAPVSDRQADQAPDKT
jgi:hypothetical protein